VVTLCADSGARRAGREHGIPATEFGIGGKGEVPIAVDGEDGGRAEGPVDRRVIKLGGEQVRAGNHPLHVLVSGDEPQADRRNEADRRSRPSRA
jgi:hypothetical protein